MTNVLTIEKLATRISSNKTINIIDRVLDLSKYDSQTSVYTLSRDWINATTSLNYDLNNKTKHHQNVEKLLNIFLSLKVKKLEN